MGLDFGEAGEGEGGAVGGGRLGHEETVQGKLDSDFLGKERELHGVVAQALLSEVLNAHGSLCSSKKEKVASLIGHGSSSSYMKENVESTFNAVAATNETKAEDEKARRVVGEGVDKCSKSHLIGCVSERLGASLCVEDVQGELHVDRGTHSKAQECAPLIGRLERGAVSGKEVVCAFNDQATFLKTLESGRDLKSKCVQDAGFENVVGEFDSEQLRFVSRIEDSLGTRPLLEEVEQSGARVEGEGAVRWSRLEDHPKLLTSHSFTGNGHADFDKLEKEEEEGLKVQLRRRVGETFLWEGCQRCWGRVRKMLWKAGVILSLRRVGCRVWLGKSEVNIP